MNELNSIKSCRGFYCVVESIQHQTIKARYLSIRGRILRFFIFEWVIIELTAHTTRFFLQFYNKSALSYCSSPSLEVSRKCHAPVCQMYCLHFCITINCSTC